MIFLKKYSFIFYSLIKKFVFFNIIRTNENNLNHFNLLAYSVVRNSDNGDNNVIL